MARRVRSDSVRTGHPVDAFPIPEKSPLHLDGPHLRAMTEWEGKEYVVADGDVMHFRFNN